MRKHVAVFLTILVAFAADARAVTIAWTRVGNAGNAPDNVVATYDGTTGYGAVPYAYNIGTYDVTVSQYVEFLNAKDPTGANVLGLYNTDMGNATVGEINFNYGNFPGSKYSVMSGDGNHPVNFVTWYEAIRFANWLNNGQGTGDTETGAYTWGTLGPGGTHNAGARIWLPSENEWYKAAYYDPRTSAQGGPPSDSHYWLYPTSSNATPISSGPTALPNHANFGINSPGLTDVGAYTGTTSPYGAFDMAGNAWQWNEALIDDLFRGQRGGSFINDSTRMLSSYRGLHGPLNTGYPVGFRVAGIVGIPEPSGAILAGLGFVGFAAWAWRRRKHSSTMCIRGRACRYR